MLLCRILLVEFSDSLIFRRGERDLRGIWLTGLGLTSLLSLETSGFLGALAVFPLSLKNCCPVLPAECLAKKF